MCGIAGIIHRDGSADIGAELTAMMDGDNVVLRDAAGNTATVTMTDVEASNGTIHAIDTVLLPSDLKPDPAVYELIALA